MGLRSGLAVGLLSAAPRPSHLSSALRVRSRGAGEGFINGECVCFVGMAGTNAKEGMWEHLRKLWDTVEGFDLSGGPEQARLRGSMAMAAAMNAWQVEHGISSKDGLEEAKLLKKCKESATEACLEALSSKAKALKLLGMGEQRPKVGDGGSAGSPWVEAVKRKGKTAGRFSKTPAGREVMFDARIWGLPRWGLSAPRLLSFLLSTARISDEAGNGVRIRKERAWDGALTLSFADKAVRAKVVRAVHRFRPDSESWWRRHWDRPLRAEISGTSLRQVEVKVLRILKRKRSGRAGGRGDRRDHAAGSQPLQTAKETLGPSGSDGGTNMGGGAIGGDGSEDAPEVIDFVPATGAETAEAGASTAVNDGVGLPTPSESTDGKSVGLADMGTGNNTSMETAKVVEDVDGGVDGAVDMEAGVATEMVDSRKSRRLQELAPENQGL